MAAIVLDNGGYSLKVGSSASDSPRVLPNCITRSKTERRKNFISSQVDECKDLSGLYYLLPFQKGYLVNWDTQRQIWDHVFGASVLDITPTDLPLIISEPLFNFPSVQENMDSVLFEEYKFQALTRLPSVTMASHHYSHAHPEAQCTLVVDCGYSFTHIAPHYRNRLIPSAVIRIEVGGKLLTNYLKETVSYRQLHVLDETYVMNQVKEDACYMSLDFHGDMMATRERGNSVTCEYVLPNFSDRRRGYIRGQEEAGRGEEEQSLVLGVERIATPEILFHPSDIGVEQMGIAEGITHSISLVPKEMHPHLYANIVLTGGCVLFRGFEERVQEEVRKLCPSDYPVCVSVEGDPVTAAWSGGRVIADKASVESVTLAEYKEFGENICQKRFSDNLTWTPDSS